MAQPLFPSASAWYNESERESLVARGSRQMSGRKLTIRVGGKHDKIAVSAFLQIVDDTMQMLDGVAKAVSKSRAPLGWQIESVSMDSPLLMTICSDSLTEEGSPDVIDPFIRGLRDIERTGKRPKQFSDELLAKARRLVSALGDTVSSIEFSSDGETAKPTRHIAANVDAVLVAPSRFYYVTTQSL